MRGYSLSRLRAGRTLFGALLESFVFSELLKLSAWTEARVMLFHYRDRDQLKVDFVLENAAVKSSVSKSNRPRDFLGLERVASAAGSAFKQGMFCTMEFKRSRSPRIFALPHCRRYGPDGSTTAVWRLPVSASANLPHPRQASRSPESHQTSALTFPDLRDRMG